MAEIKTKELIGRLNKITAPLRDIKITTNRCHNAQ